MPVFNILTSQERKEFDSPPKFTGEERKKYFRLNKELEAILMNLRRPTTKVSFLLMYAYYQKSGKLFNDYHIEDVSYAITSLKLDEKEVKMEKFTRFVFRSLKNIFLNQLSIKEFESKTEMKIRAEIRFALRSQTRHRQIFGSIADRLVKEQILLPSYNTLASLIDEEVKRYDRDIEAKLKDCLSEQDITEFEKLLTKVESDESRKTEGYGEIEEEVDETKPENTPYILTVGLPQITQTQL